MGRIRGGPIVAAGAVLVTRREILHAVADGRMQPAEAVVLLAQAAKSDDPNAEPEREREVGPDRQAGLALLSIRCAYRYVRVVGDASTPRVSVVSGRHGLVRDGATLRVTEAPTGASFAGATPGDELLVRVNPGLDVEVDLTGGRLALANVGAGLRVTIRAGSAALEEITGGLRLDVVGGSATVSGTPSADWAIRAESASLSVRLGAGSDATITATGRHSNLDVRGQAGPVTLGHGTYAVAIDVAFSDVAVG